MTYPSGPLQPLPLDGPGQRRRRLATAAGILAVAGIVVAGVALTNRPARQPVSPQEALGSPASASAGATASSTHSPGPSSAASAAASTGSGTSAPPAPTAGSADIDGDGHPDVASVQFVNKRSAQLVVRLSVGKTLRSRPIPLYHQDGAGTVTPFDVNGDGLSELLVNDPGADGTGYDLFAYVHGRLVEVAAPKGQQQPFLYNGGGMYYQSSFGCTGHKLVVAQEKPLVASTASLPPDPRFTVTTTSYTLTDGALTQASSSTATLPDRAAAAAALARTANACGAEP